MRNTIPTLGVISAGLLLAGSPAQAAGTTMSSGLNIGIANGNQASLPIQAPINVCGNAIGLLGSASANCVGGAKANLASGHGHGHGGGDATMSSGGGDATMSSVLNPGIANGNQIVGQVQVPVNVCGNAIGILGSATASCTRSGASASAYSNDHHHRPAERPYGTPARAIAPVKAPVKLRVVAAKPRTAEQGLLANLLSPVSGLLGAESKTKVARHGYSSGDHGGKTCGNVGMSSSGNIGIANGNQVHAPIQVPINFSGNAISILGGPTSASSQGGASAKYC